MNTLRKITMMGVLILPFLVQSQITPKRTQKRISQASKINVEAKTLTRPERITTKNFEGLRPKQVAQLPAATVDRAALLRLRYNESWEITPGKFQDKDMVVISYFGTYERSPSYISVHPENKYYPEANYGAPGFFPELRYLVLRFNPEKGKRYRIRIQLKPGDYNNKKVMTNVTGRYNDTWYINDQYDEVLFDFIGASNEIKISPIIAGAESNFIKYEPLEIANIKVDKIDE